MPEELQGMDSDQFNSASNHAEIERDLGDQVESYRNLAQEARESLDNIDTAYSALSSFITKEGQYIGSENMKVFDQVLAKLNTFKNNQLESLRKFRKTRDAGTIRRDANLWQAQQHFHDNEQAYREQAINQAEATGHEISRDTILPDSYPAPQPPEAPDTPPTPPEVTS